MSLEPNEANKKAALEQLRFKKSQKSRPNSSDPVASTSSSNTPSHPGFAAQPSQSRDATVSSRYFPPAPSTYGNVLVPNSSPLRAEASYRPYQPYNHSPQHDVAAITGLVHSNATGGSFGGDPLSAPSGFASPHATFPRQWGDNGRRMSDVGDVGGDGPPRKRMRGSSQNPLNVSGSPSTSEVQRPGQRRKITGNGVNNTPVSVAETSHNVQDLFDSPLKPRIVRSRADSNGSPSSVTTQLEPEDPKLIRFAMTMPEHKKEDVHRAWHETSGDARKATQLLQNPAWVRSPKQQQAEAVGRVKEVDEALKAQRAAAKELGKNSLIYANRPTARPATPPLSKGAPATAPSPVTPISPIVSRPRGKRLKKAVIDSDSETEAEEIHHLSKRQKVTTDESQVLDYLNSKGPAGIQELTGCTPPQAAKIIELRPFRDIEDLNVKLGQGKKKAGPGGISPRMFEDCTTIFAGYGAVDAVLEDCEDIGVSLREAIASWTPNDTKGKGKQIDSILSSGGSSRDSPAVGQTDGAISLVSLQAIKTHASKDFIASQPTLLREGTVLKDYQLLGVSWLNLLYRRNLSCILADEMGLGKTIQVISFFAHLKENGNRGPHLVVVPASTLENWLREFKQFAPDISVTAYYAGKEERPRLRQDLLASQASTNKNGDGWEVLVTTYALAQGDDRDRKFFRRIEWDSCVFDEGHSLKNFESQRYKSLIQYGSNWRLLLTGTPLQNNLQELVSLMNFILPDHFAGSMESLRAIFKVKGDTKVSLLAQERVSRAKKMMTPFVLRRRKDQVAKDLPKKTERIEWCSMTKLQESIYRDALQRSRKTILDAEAGTGTPTADPAENGVGKPVKKKTRNPARSKDKMYLENSSNVLMDLRKASSHPMLFRRRFNDQTLAAVAKVLVKEPDFKKRGAILEFVKEDMEVMTDAELQLFFSEYKATRKYLLDESCYLEAGKVTVLLRLLDDFIKQGRKVLVFSQFVQILDILKVVMKQKDINYLMLTGSTPVDVRQSLVDQFTNDDNMELPVFLLSTKAGGMGINLTASSVVILYDQDFNPHNDKQAQDRAYRIGQKRDVEVIKLITRNTIEEDMLTLAQTKLALDDAVAGDTEERDSKEESAPAKEMKTSLMNVLRQKFETKSDENDAVEDASSSTSGDVAMDTEST